MASIHNLFHNQSSSLEPSSKTLVLNSIKRDWKKYLNSSGEIKLSYLNGKFGWYDAFFVRIALRILSIEDVKEFGNLSEQGTLRLIAGYSAFLPWDGFYLVPGLPKRADIYQKALGSLGNDKFRNVIQEQYDLCHTAVLERTQSYYDLAALKLQCQKAKLPLKGRALIEQAKQMNKDDWHGLVTSLRFDLCENLMSWLVDQPLLDLGTAIRFVFESDCIEDIVHNPSCFRVTRKKTYPHIVRRTVHYIVSGFYSVHDFSAFDDPEMLQLIEPIRSRVAKRGGSAFAISAEQLAKLGLRRPEPRYSLEYSSRVQYDFDYWRKHLRDQA